MKKKIFVFFIAFFTLFNGILSAPLYAMESTSLSDEEINNLKPVIELTLETLEKTDITVNNIIPLYDVNNNPSYVLCELLNGGYAIFTRENMVLSEYSLDRNSPYLNETGKYFKYEGYKNYSSTNELISTFSNESSDIISSNNSLLSETNPFVINNLSNPPLPSTGLNVDWIGVDENKMALYNWPQFHEYDFSGNGICGTAATTILLAYFDDYVSNAIVPSVVRNQFSAAPEMLYEVMFYNIDQPHPNGTLPNDIASGINNFFNTYRPHFEYHNFRANAHIGVTMGPAMPYLKKSRPIALGLLSALPGNPYGNHWVTAYAYSTDPTNTYYKVVDNWAPDVNNFPIKSENYRAAVHKTWTSSFVSLDQF